MKTTTKADFDGIAVSSGELLKGTIVSFSNNVGGTSVLPEGRYKVKIVGGFEDYETGTIVHGRLVDPAQIEAARKAGSVHKAGWRLPKLPDGHAETAVQTHTVFDPSFVMFNTGRGGWLPGSAT